MLPFTRYRRVAGRTGRANLHMRKPAYKGRVCRGDRITYENRWGIEGFFARLKQYRRIATRYDKLAQNFLGFIKLASIMLWLK